MLIEPPVLGEKPGNSDGWHGLRFGEHTPRGSGKHPFGWGKPVRAKPVSGNLGEAKWLALSASVALGAVYLSACGADVSFRAGIRGEAAHLEKAETGEFTLVPRPMKPVEIIFEMTSLERAWFGEKWRVKVVPK